MNKDALREGYITLLRVKALEIVNKLDDTAMNSATNLTLMRVMTCIEKASEEIDHILDAEDQ